MAIISLQRVDIIYDSATIKSFSRMKQQKNYRDQ